MSQRRTLWPVSLMQDWIASCLCPLLEQDKPTQPTIRGGNSNTVSGSATIVGGNANTIVGGHGASIVGGNANTVAGGFDAPPVEIRPTRPIEILPATPMAAGSGPDVVIDPNSAPLNRAVGPAGGPTPMPTEEVAKLRDQLDGSVNGINGIGTARAAALADIGVTTEGQFVTAPPARLATALNLPEAKVTEMKQEVNMKRNLGLAFGRAG